MLSVACAWLYRQQQKQSRQETEQFLSAIARLKVQEVIRWRSERLAYPAALSESPIFLESVQRWMISRRQTDSQRLLDRFRSVQSHYAYWDVMLTDLEGKIFLSLSGSAGSKLPEQVAGSLDAALAEKRPVMSDMVPGEGSLPDRVYIITPLADISKKPVIPFGTIILVGNIQHDLYPSIQTWPIASETAESLLVCRDGDSVLFFNELRHAKAAGSRKRILLTQTGHPAVMAVLGKEGAVEGVDYRGVEVFANIQPIPRTAWHIVAKIDKSEALEEGQFLGLLIIGLIASLFLAAAAITWAMWQRSMKANYRLRLESEEARRESEERYGITLMSIGDGVIVTDRNGKVTLMNPVAENLTGWKQDEACGKPIEEVFNSFDELTRQRIDNPIRLVIEKGRATGFPDLVCLLSRDGKEYPIKDSSAPIRNQDGDLIGVVLVFRDQTVERTAEKLLQTERDKLKESAALLNAMSAAARIGGWELDVRTMKGVWSDEMYHIFDIPYGQKPELADAVRLYYHPDEQEKISRAIQRAIEKGEGYDLEMRFISAKGRHMWVRAICKPVVENGKTVRLTGVFQDITGRKKAEEQRNQLQEQLQQAMKMEAVGRLAGGVAHDFNNLLTGITGYADLILSGLESDNPYYDDLKEIQKAAQSAVDLARQLLVFSRKKLIEPKIVNLNNLIYRLQRMLTRSIGEDIELKMLPYDQLGSVKVDPGQFEQILINLAINARDAMPDGGRLFITTANIDLDDPYCKTHPYVQPGPYVMLEVKDTGQGMSREVKNHLFEPFFTTKPKGRGTGLGLATIYGAVKQSGGSIEVDSEVGEGSTFRIYLPRVMDTPEQGERDLSYKLNMPGGAETILLVEDERIVRELAIKILKRLGYNILDAADGPQAIAIAEKYEDTIHLLMTDVVMPGMNGFQLAEHLIRIHPGMKILYTSGYTDDAAGSQRIIEDDLNFIAKPYSLQDLAQRIRELLD
ncbi:MAG: PAS domain S-box protein [Acidobacteria bacterium]|nr:PAS domain S-box protein [Acidobacteriota bacterium]